MVALRDVVAAVHDRYPPTLAESWDAVGLVCGDPDAAVERILLAVDPVATVVDEALEWGADLLLTHHPLLLHGVHSVAAHTPKGRLVHRLITAGTGLLCAHTNADSAVDGVSDALAEALGVRDVEPLQPIVAGEDKLVVFVPQASVQEVVAALAEVGAGRIGAYERCVWSTAGVGSFRPLPGAQPTVGAVGQVEQVAEDRVEMVLPPSLRAAALRALRDAHPYEEPAFDIYPTTPLPTAQGLGRVGRLAEPTRLADFVSIVAGALPATAGGVRAAGQRDALVERVAVCGGAGDSLLDVAHGSGADVFVTADLRHHPAGEHIEGESSMALVDVAHWASEWPWLRTAAQWLTADLGVTTRVSTRCTDPWTLHESP